MKQIFFIVSFLTLCMMAVTVRADDALPDVVEFNRDIRPLLSDNCFFCHGPDKNHRKADLRLDQPEGLFRKDGDTTIIEPRKPDHSELMRRLTTQDEDDRMPPAETNKSLSPRDIAMIRKWIEQGAEYEGHWLYQPIRKRQPPAVADESAVRNDIDRFILAKLDRQGIAPSTAADRITLIRRLYFDVIGLPPTPRQVQAFVADSRPDAYERVVDELLLSPHYGERMAAYWLDLVRFADTVGYHGDQPMPIYPYRDYVIQAFNDNMPFDQFTREQLAGDLLENPTLQQRVATGYNRLNMKTTEGGAQDKEYRAKYMADRVRNVSVVWMGSTLGCAECHDHKFDPFSTKDFYRMGAFFADVKQLGYYPAGFPAENWGEEIRVPTPEQAKERAQLQDQLAELQRRYAEESPALIEARTQWIAAMKAGNRDEPVASPWHVLGPFAGESFEAAYARAFIAEDALAIDTAQTYAEGKLRWQPRPEFVDGQVHPLTGDNSATYLYRTIEVPADRALALSLGSDDAIKVFLNGKPVLEKFVARGAAPDQEKITLNLKKGVNHLLMKIVNGTQGYAFYYQPVREISKELEQALTAEAPAEPQRKLIDDTFRQTTPLLAEVREQVAKVNEQLTSLTNAMPRSLVTVATDPQITRVLARGNWMDDSGEVVEPGVPHFLAQIERPGRATRLDLANWLTDSENPLTARVFVSRLWKLYFGYGLSRNLDDMGSQGVLPTHPQLLDYLATRFIESGWDIKAMHKLILMSGTYQQSSLMPENLRSLDPFNKLYARQSRWRLDAEMVRDNALAISGLLARDIGGPSAKPYQPPKYYSQLNFPLREYEADKGTQQYRRGVYTWWQRQYLHPMMLAFDAPAREECTAQRNRSNIPQQALVLLNDPSFVEAARALATQLLTDTGEGAEGRIDYLFAHVLHRKPVKQEKALLLELLADQQAHFQQNPSTAAELLSVGISPAPATADAVELATWTSMARTVMNTYEAISRN